MLPFAPLKKSSELIAWSLSSLSFLCICWCLQTPAFAAPLQNAEHSAFPAYHGPCSIQVLCWLHSCLQICSHLCCGSLLWCQVFSTVSVKATCYSPFKVVTLDRVTSAAWQILIALPGVSSATRPLSLPLSAHSPVADQSLALLRFIFLSVLIKPCLLYVPFFFHGAPACLRFLCRTSVISVLGLSRLKATREIKCFKTRQCQKQGYCLDTFLFPANYCLRQQ